MQKELSVMEIADDTCQHGTLFTEWCPACAKQLEYYNKMDNLAKVPGKTDQEIHDNILECYNKMDNVTKLVPGKTDQEIADDIRRRLIDAYRPLLDLADEAKDNGLVFQCAIGENAFGKFVITNCQIMKVYK
jgi:hypothetical protein